MKQFIIAVNDIVCYILLAVVFLFAAVVALTNPIHGLIAAGGGFVLVSFITGYWMVLSSIAESTQRQVLLAEQQLEAIKKLNRNLDAYQNNQFPNV